jgi:16S rRNA (guanine(966)-N(2))-methyltransferase RsmD
MLRIISGKYKGFKLNLVPSKKTKSTSHLVRKALFDTLGNIINNSIVLDLFSGSGSYGFEAISRNAKKIYLIDNLFPAFETLKKNQKKLNLSNEKVHIFFSNAFKILKKFKKQKILFDIIILDPPYFCNLHNLLFKQLDEITHSKSIIIFEINHKTNLPKETEKFITIRKKKYGSKKLNYYKKKQ